MKEMETQLFPMSKKIQDRSSSRVLMCVFWDKDGILFVDYLEKSATMTAKHYVTLLNKCQGKLSNVILFLQDSSDPQKEAIMHQKLVDLHFEVLKHPAYLSVWPIWTTTFLQTS
jgi:hypothetical protein